MSRDSLIWMGALILSACVGYVSDPGAEGVGGGRGGGGGGSSGGGAGGTGGTGGSEDNRPLDCSQPKAAAMRLRLLTETQYSNTVLDILQVSGSPAKGLGQKLDDTSLEQRATAAGNVARQAVTSLAKWAPCTPPASGSATACEEQIIDKVSAKLYRRPLTEAERAELKKLFDAGIKEKDFSTGVEWFLTGILQSPDYMYEVVRPAATEAPGEVRALSGHEYASRLAYFIWDGPPDDALTAAATKNELADPAKRDAQIARMIQDAKSSRGVTQFYTRWMRIGAFTELARNVTGFDQQVVSSLATSLLMAGTELYASPNPNISSLLTGDKYYFNDVLRKFYGLSGSGTSFVATAMPGENRRGLLTHPALMALQARPAETHPIGRGLFLLRNVLCKVVPVPPVAAIPQPAAGDGVSTRERLDAHTADPACQACHAMINAAGYVFEGYDQVGRHRTMDQGKPVDSHGELLIGKDTDSTFTTGDEFLAKLEDSQDVRSCFARSYLNFALSHAETDPADACSAQALGQSFGASGDLKQLIASVAGSDSFRLRLGEGVGK